MVGGSFLNVSSTSTFRLGDLSFSGYDAEEGAWGTAMLQQKDTFGRVAKTPEGAKKIYCWYDYDDGAGDAKHGWYDEDGENKWDDEITFDAGTAFWVYGEGCSVVSAGQVNFGSVAVATSSTGAVAVGNPYPTTITLADISFSGYDVGEGAWGSAMLQEKDTFGRIAKTEGGAKKVYCWYDYDDGAGDAKHGWYDEDGENKWDDDISFAVGTGFWVYGEGCTVEFTFPGDK